MTPFTDYSSTPILPYKILKRLDVADLEDIVRSVEGITDKSSEDYWLYWRSLRFMIGLINMPEGYTPEIGKQLYDAAQKWRKGLNETD